MSWQKDLSIGVKAITTLLFVAALFCCLCILNATPVHASTDIGPRTTISNLPEGEYIMDSGEYYVDGDMAGEYEFNVPAGKTVQVYIHGHSIDGGKDGEDLFHVGSGASLELIGVSEDGESGTKHGENTVVHLWDYLLFKGWFYDFEEDQAITGPALINFEHAVRLEDGATLTAKELSFSGSKLSGIMIDGSNTTVNLENSAITYTSEKSSGGIFIDGDSNTVNLKNTLLWENRNYDSKKGGHIKAIGDGNKILGDESATGDDCSCLKNGKTKNYGGAIYLEGDNCEIAYLLVKNNVAKHEGGAFYIDGNGANIHDVEFDSNRAFWEFVDIGTDYDDYDGEYSYDDSEAFGERGGAICLYGEDASIRNCMFAENKTLGEDTDEGGGAIFLDGANHTVDSCTFELNRLDIPCSYENDLWIGWSGGAINIQSENTTISNSSIRGSYAGLYGGAVYSDAVKTRIENCIIENNETYYEVARGGGICFDESDTVVKGCTIRGNAAGKRWDTEGFGGGIYYDGDNNIIENTTIENNSSGLNFGKGVYVNNENLTLDGRVIIRNNSNESGPQWSNLYLHKSTELSVVGGKLADGSEVWLDSKWGREDNPTEGYIYHDSKATSLNRTSFYSDRLGYSFTEKKGTLYYSKGADYPEVAIAPPTLSVEPKDEAWTESPGKVYINTDPLYTFSKEDKHYTVTKTVGENAEELTFENEGIKTDENGDYVELTGKAATYEFSLYNTLTIKLQDGSTKVLGTSDATEATYTLSVPAEKCQVKVQRAYWGDMEPLFNDIGSFAPGARVEKKLNNQVLVVGLEPVKWQIEYHKKDTDDDAVETIENFHVEYNTSTKEIAFTMPEDADGGTAKVTVTESRLESRAITYKTNLQECESLLPADPEDPSKHEIAVDYGSELRIKPIQGEVGGTTYYTEAIIVDGENIGIDGKTINKVRDDLEIEYIFSTEIQTFDVTYDLEGTGLTEEDLYHKVSINETYNKGQSYLDKHEGNAGVNKKADIGSSSLVVDHFQIGVDNGSGELTFSEDKTLGIDEPVTESMTLRMVLAPSFRGNVRYDSGAYLKAIGNNEIRESFYTPDDSIDVGIKEEYKRAEYKNKVVDYWTVTRLHQRTTSYSEDPLSTDEVRANGQAVSQNPGAEKEIYYKVSENSISVPLTDDMVHNRDIKKQVTVFVNPIYKDPVTNITGVPDTLEVGESWNPSTAAIWPETVKNTPVTWKVLSSSGKEALEGAFEPTESGKYTLEATAKNGLGLCKDYTQTFNITVPGATEYRVSFDANAGDEVDSPPDQYVTEGSTAEKPDDPVWEGHVFDGWYVTEEGEEVPYDFNSPVISDVALKAHWKGLYNVTATVTSNGEGATHGSVSVTGDMVGEKYVGGGEVIITVTPDQNYKVKGWKDNGIQVEGNDTQVYKIIDLDADHAVSVEFEEIVVPVEKHTVTVHTGAYADKGTVTGAGEYAPGEAVTVEAIPDEGYVSIIGWNEAINGGTWLPGGFITSANPYTFAMGNEDVDLLVWFDKEITDIELTSATEIDAESEYTPTAEVHPSASERSYGNSERVIWEMVSCPDDTTYEGAGTDAFKVTNAGVTGGTLVLRANIRFEFRGELLYSYSQEYAIKVNPPVAETYTVDFKDGENVIASKSVTSGGKIADIGKINKAGYRFDGWFNGDTEYDFNQPVEENLTLTAKWTKADKVASTVTCTKPGLVEHYQIGSGEDAKYYIDEYMLNEVLRKDLEKSAMGHSWDDATYTWSSDNSTVTAQRVCLRDNCGEKETETTAAEFTVIVEPTKEERGLMRYTATFVNKAFTEQIKEVQIPSGDEEEAAEKAKAKEDLGKTLDSVAGLKASTYTPASWQKFSNAVANAKQILAKEDATKAEYDAAINAVNAAQKALVTKDSLVKAGKTYKVKGSSYKVLKKAKKSAGTVAFVKAKKAKTITVPARVKLADGKYYNVSKIGKKAFAKTKTKTVVVKTKKLTKKSVKGSLKGSKVKTIKVKVGKKKINKKYVKKYKKIFTKKNAGRKVKVR